ncbi:MAG: glutathione peroxidase [Gammaproteobacteria bacterium]|jgi:glutathione peroxidase|tara:strand:- start:1247 stop:1843 length:597 start_codon:yes stop_codon:yes gene_type:complete
MKILFITVSLIFLGCSQESNNAEKLMSYDFQPDLNKIPVEGCPAILNHEIRLLDSKEVINLCKHKDKVILAVNVASRCGFTYQYEALQNLFDGYKEEDFVILGFPSRDFMYQEFDDEGKVKEFCNTKYGVSFPMFATSSVKGKKANSFYQNLALITGKSPDWNFTKYLISKDGEVLKPFSKNIEPDSKEIISAIEGLL